MEPNLFICVICMESYDEKNRVPRMLSCGHTFCSFCFKNMLGGQNRLRCPNDASVFTISSVDQIPINFALKQMTDYFSNSRRKEYCEIHQGKEKNHVCITDKSKICSFCALDGHKNHIIQHIELFRASAEAKTEKLKSFTKKIQSHQNVFDNFSDEKYNLKKKIKDEFISLTNILKSHEEKLLNTLDIFSKQTDHLRALEIQSAKANSMISKLNNIDVNEESFLVLNEEEPAMPVVPDYQVSLDKFKIIEKQIKSDLAGIINVLNSQTIIVDKTVKSLPQEGYDMKLKPQESGQPIKKLVASSSPFKL